MVFPLAALLPVAGAAIGGITGYQRSGGNLGSAALGAGLGATVPGGFRMAGTALGGLGVGALSKTPLGGLLAAQMAKQGGASLLSKIPAAAGLAAGGLGLLATPALAGSQAAALAPAARTGAQTALGAVGYQTAPPIDYASMGDAVPPVGTYGGGGTLSDPASVLGPRGMAESLQSQRTTQDQLNALRTLMPEIAKAGEFRSKQELQRQLAAAGVRQNIATAANMLERSQQAAQQMGANAASQMGSALTQQYQYS